MTQSTQTFEHLLRTAEYWRPSYGGAFSAYVYQEDDGYFLEQLVTPDILDAYHPDMVQVLTAMTRWAGRSSGDYRAGGIEVKCNAALLKGDTIAITDTAGRELRLAYFDAPNIPSALNLRDRVYIYGYHLNTHVLNIDGTDVTFVLEAKNWDWGVYRTELEARYPGWENKQVVAKELGLDIDAQLRYMFTPAIVQELELPETFLNELRLG